VEERTRDVYEAIAAYPQALPVPLPAEGDLESLAQVGLRLTPLSRAVTRAAFRMSGFDRFLRRLPDMAEDLFRRHQLREAHLCGPVTAATLVLADDERAPDAVTRAATLVVAARRLHDDLRAGRLAPDRQRDEVLEMGRYPNLFGTSLIVDHTNPTPRMFKTPRTYQITVVVGRRLYILPVGDLAGGTAVDELAHALRDLVTLAVRNRLPADELPAGVLTAASHDTQRAIFTRVAKREANARSLLALRHSFLTLCLDVDSHPGSAADAGASAHTGNCGNRWYHSSLQLVVFGNGRACAIVNAAAYLDGHVMVRAAAELQRGAAAVPLPGTDGVPTGALPPPRLLSWDIPAPLFARALDDLRSLQDNQPSTFTVPEVGGAFFARHGVDPTAAFVVALQYATRRLRAGPTVIRQVLTMARHRCTDLQTAAVSTPEVMALVEQLMYESRPPSAARGLLRQAIESQARVCREVRKAVPLSELGLLYLASLSGVRRLWTRLVLGGAMKLLAMLGHLRPQLHDVLVSSPSIFKEVPLVGRPGTRIPYVHAYGLHYQVHRDHVVVCVAPSMSWTVPNAELMTELRAGLERVQQVIEGG
jgi:hypothetical protein